jgi:hypothetical protein
MAPATIKPGPKMTQAREGQAAVRLDDGRVLIMGGTIPFTGKCEMACVAPATASVEIYDPKTGKFSRSGSLAEPRTGGQALLLNDGRVLVSGGYGDAGQDLSTIEIYDPARKASAAVTPPAGIHGLPADSTAVKLADGRVLIAGGMYDQATSSSNSTLIFDPATGGFVDGPLMAQPRQAPLATLLDDGRVLIAGGDYYENGYGSQKDSSELIDPSRPLAAATLLQSQDPATATLLTDGRVLLAGGGPYVDGASCQTPVVPQAFDPKTGSVTTVSPMSKPRTGSAAIELPDGRVLIFGGVDASCTPARTVEAFDPDSGTFQVIATGFPDISEGSATLLSDGQVLIAGGHGSIGWNLSTATWLLKP